jgi:hypothetical protein
VKIVINGHIIEQVSKTKYHVCKIYEQLTEQVMLLIIIKEVLGSNLGRNIDYPDSSPSRLQLVLYLKLGQDHFICFHYIIHYY